LSKRTLLWLVPAAAYLAFTIWYTDLSGPLTQAEVDAYAQRMLASGASPEQAGAVRADGSDGDSYRVYFSHGREPRRARGGPRPAVLAVTFRRRSSGWLVTDWVVRLDFPRWR